MKSGDWFDWAHLRWDGYDGPLVAQLLMFIDVTTMMFEDLEPSNPPRPIFPTIDEEIIVLSHSVNANSLSMQRSPALPHRGERQGPVTRIAQFAEMEETYQYAPISCILRPAFVITDRTGDKTAIKPGCSKYIVSISPRDKWHLSFIDYSDENLLNDASSKVDDDIDENDEVYKYEG